MARKPSALVEPQRTGHVLAVDAEAARRQSCRGRRPQRLGDDRRRHAAAPRLRQDADLAEYDLPRAGGGGVGLVDVGQDVADDGAVLERRAPTGPAGSRADR